MDWVQMVYQNWKDLSLNLLRNSDSTLDSGQVEQWPDNRIGYLQPVWRLRRNRKPDSTVNAVGADLSIGGAVGLTTCECH